MAENPDNLRRANLSDLQKEETPIDAYCTNLPGEGRALLALITKVRSTSDFESDDIPPTGFPVKFFYAHPVEMEQTGTGEMVRQTRVVLINKDMETISFVSQGVVSGLSLIHTHLGHGPWTPELMVVLRKKKTNKGRQVYSLEVLD